MKKILIVFFIFFYPHLSFAESNNKYYEKYFYIGKMKSHHDKFTLFFKTREKAIIAKGENSNYINDYPQDLYIYDHFTEKEYPLISYDWFPKKAKKFFKSYKYPVFPEDFAYYLLNDNNTLVLVSAHKDYNQNLIYNINKKELGIQNNHGKLNFIISTYAQNCGYKSIKSNFECNIYKPLISKNLFN
tara:strand:- start:320 stop:880 length:561 start_codon:yes stop_codon:yes gene_type:complete